MIAQFLAILFLSRDIAHREHLLKKYLALLEKNRYNAVEKTGSALQNKIDEIVGQFLSTLYKLENLK
jgi:hypothetical protein